MNFDLPQLARLALLVSMSKRKLFTVEEVLSQLFDEDEEGEETLLMNSSAHDSALISIEQELGIKNPCSDVESGSESESAFSDDEMLSEKTYSEIQHSSQESVQFNVHEASSQESKPVNVIMPHDDCDPIWRGERPTVCVEQPFTGESGVSDNVLDCSEPIDFFYLIFTEELADSIVNFTNMYAEQELIKAGPLPIRSRLRKWKRVTRNEIYLYTALVFYRGVVWKPTYEMYYMKDDVFTTPFVTKILSYDRFLLIDRFLHFCNNESLSFLDIKTAKIKHVFDYVESKFSELYTPERDICVDESLMLWKGRLSWKQFIKTKRSRFGIKSFSLCESSSGYLWSSCLYTGKELTDKLNAKNDSQYDYVATDVVLHLMKGLVGKGYRLHLDNWYNSIELTRCLLANKTDVVGTLRANRRGLPKELINMKLNPGECVHGFDQHSIMLTKWKDKKDINLISTFIDENTWVKVTRAGKDKEIPLAVHIYNNGMGGVDRSDQMLSSYECERKRVKKWYKKSFMHILNAIAFNCNILCGKVGHSMTQLEFRKKLVLSLVQNHHQEVIKPKKGRPAVIDVVRLNERHFPKFVPPTEKKHNSMRKCKVCSENGKRAESRYQCSDCDVGLCVVPCFEIYHTKKNLKS